MENLSTMRGKPVERVRRMQVHNAQEALFIACEMERGAVQMYERSLALMDELGRTDEDVYQQLSSTLNDEKRHLSQFRSLYTGVDAESERCLTLAAVAQSVLFKGGLMGAVREGLLKDAESMLAFAAESEEIPS